MRLHKNTAHFLPFDRLSDLSLKTRWVALVQGNYSPAKQTAADKKLVDDITFRTA